jgi:hypothetical protein
MRAPHQHKKANTVVVIEADGAVVVALRLHPLPVFCVRVKQCPTRTSASALSQQHVRATVFALHGSDHVQCCNTSGALCRGIGQALVVTV